MVGTKNFLNDLRLECKHMIKSGESNGFKDLHMGRVRDNRIPLDDDVNYGRPHLNFEFGDLRLNKPGVSIVVEAESAGGVTNEAKYWYLLDSGKITDKIDLIHVYIKNTENDYEVHHRVWDFLDRKMKRALKEKYASTWMPLMIKSYYESYNKIVEELKNRIRKY